MVQLKDLAATIAAVPCDAVLLGTPHDLTAVLTVSQPVVSVTYAVDDVPESVMQGLAGGGANGGPTNTELGTASGLRQQLVEFLKQQPV